MKKLFAIKRKASKLNYDEIKEYRNAVFGRSLGAPPFKDNIVFEVIKEGLA